ncbi:MAG: glycosyl hydrolase [Akkermansiaceae bacterium]|nr:glycosyl hydrolase [Verrucomicrobiales bacterium]
MTNTFIDFLAMHHIATTEHAVFAEQPAPQLLKMNGVGSKPDLCILEEETITWRGFGGCFNELGWNALAHLPAAKQEAVLDQLFAPGGDLKFEFCRLPIGASDYADDWYSLAETPGDWELRDFSIERDRIKLLPYVKAALLRRPDLELFSSPWSPPAWLKRPAVMNSGKLPMESRTLSTYADYFVKYVQAYAAEGVTIQQIHPQNEPCSSQKFPSCVLTGEELRIFIGQYLGPAFARAGLPTEIWLGTLNSTEPDDDRKLWTSFNDYAFTVLQDEAAARYVRGVAYQWAGKYSVWKTRIAYPDLPLIQSENECGDGKNSWRYAWYIADLIHHYLAQDTCGYVYWNMVLEPEGHSTWGWQQNSLFTVDPATRELTTNPEFHILRHYASFIPRGSRRRLCSQPWAANATAYRTPANELVCVVHNPLHHEHRLTVEQGDHTWAIPLPARSLNTLVI